MATYKVWLTVKDTNGQQKEISVGTINVDLSELSQDEILKIEESLPFVTAQELTETVEDKVDEKVDEKVAEQETIRYAGFFDAQ